MSVAFVSSVESWPPPPLGVFPLEVVEGAHRDEFATMFQPSLAEVTITGPYTRGEPILVVAVAFGSLDQALRAGTLLAEAFDAVKAIQAEPLPDPMLCEHRVRETRFARAKPKTRICELCCANLGDVDG